MTNIKEIIHTYNLDANRRYKDGSFTSAMKEYATWYAKECLKIAADKAYMSHNGIGMITNTGNLWNCEINKGSILNIKLPDHD